MNIKWASILYSRGTDRVSVYHLHEHESTIRNFRDFLRLLGMQDQAMKAPGAARQTNTPGIHSLHYRRSLPNRFTCWLRRVVNFRFIDSDVLPTLLILYNRGPDPWKWRVALGSFSFTSMPHRQLNSISTRICNCRFAHAYLNPHFHWQSSGKAGKNCTDLLSC